MKTLLFFLALLSISSSLLAQEKRDIMLTIYNSNVALVKETRVIKFDKGINNIFLPGFTANVNPNTVMVKTGAGLTEMNYRISHADANMALAGNIGKRVIFVNAEAPQSEVSGTLLYIDAAMAIVQESASKITYLRKLEDYRISVTEAPAVLNPQQGIDLIVNSETGAAKPVDIIYQVNGINWEANYNAILKDNDRKLDVAASANLSNYSGMDFKNAGLRLVAGDINRVAPPPALYEGDMAMRMEKSVANQGGFQEAPSFEYHVYNLDRKVDLLNNQVKQINLFDASDVPVVKKYLIRQNFGIYYRAPQQNAGGVEIALNFRNSKNNKLGEPMPMGTVRVYSEEKGVTTLLGEDRIMHTAEGEEININIGKSFDINYEENMVESNQISDKINEQTYEIKITNSKDENVDVTVQRMLGTNWEITDTNIKPVKKNASTAEFIVPVKAKSEAVLRYTVRYTYR